MLWSWRPELWTMPCPSSSGPVVQRGARLTSNTKVFFGGADCAVIVKQLRNDISQGFAPYGVALELFQFDGSFLSLAIDLPDSLCGTFAKDELIGLSGEIFAERATGFTVRLNIKHGPNTEQLIQAHDLNQSDIEVEFDLEHLKINVNRVEKIGWIWCLRSRILTAFHLQILHLTSAHGARLDAEGRNMSHLTHYELRNGIWSGRLEGAADAPNVIDTY